MSLLSYHSERKKHSYSASYSRSLDLKNGFKSVSNSTQLKILYRLETIFQILYKKVLFNYITFFRNLKMVLDNNSHPDKPFEKKLFKYIDRFFYILKHNNLKMQALFFHHMKNHYQGRILIEKVNFVLARIALRNLSTSSRIKKFKKLLTCSSKRARIYQQGLKARFFMAVCENIVTKANIPKELYKSFREWHLQSVLKKLSNLNEEQKGMLCKQKEIVCHLLGDCVTRYLRKIFWRLKLHSGNLELINEKLSYNLSLNYLVEKISAPFLKHSLLLFPRANWNSSKMDALSLLKMCHFFKKLATFSSPKDKALYDKSRSILILCKSIQRRLFLIKESTYRHLIMAFPQPYFNGKAKRSQKISIQPENIKAFSELISRLVRKRCFEAFIKLLPGGWKQDKILEKKINIQYGLKVLETLCSNFYEQTQRCSLYKWKRIALNSRHEKAKEKSKEIKSKRNQVKARKLKTALSSILFNNLSWGFQSIIESSLARENSKLSGQEVTQQRDQISMEKKILVDIIKNQAMVNAKLERSHQKKASDSLMLTYQYQQVNILQTFFYKDYLRAQHNSQVLQRVFKKWQCKTSFDNSKIKEYNNLLRILEGERDIYAADIQQIEQARLEKAEIYLKNLEEVNSDLIEMVKPHEDELEGPKAQEILFENAYKRKRNLSF